MLGRKGVDIGKQRVEFHLARLVKRYQARHGLFVPGDDDFLARRLMRSRSCKNLVLASKAATVVGDFMRCSPINGLKTSVSASDPDYACGSCR